VGINAGKGVFMNKQKQIEEMAKEFCPHYADGKCYYETNEVSTCDCECEFCWAVSVLLKAGYRKGNIAEIMRDQIDREISRLQAEKVDNCDNVNKLLYIDGQIKGLQMAKGLL
jgi:DNA repair photolyase